MLPSDTHFTTNDDALADADCQGMLWAAIAVALVALWVGSLWKILFGGANVSKCIPSIPTFLPADGGSPPRRRNVMLVIAHPDDESMFFTPTILYLNSQGHIIHLLCMSLGNADGLGRTRREELFHACAALMIPSEKVKIIDHPNLQDGFNEHWDSCLLAGLVKEHIEMWNIDLLLTFDKYGVSGHPNHCDVHHGICTLRFQTLRADFEAWELVSLNLLHKYSGPLGIWLPMLHSWRSSKPQSYCIVNVSPSRTYKAMSEHSSQWVWFRKLFVLFSSYSYMNTVRKINL